MMRFSLPKVLTSFFNYLKKNILFLSAASFILVSTSAFNLAVKEIKPKVLSFRAVNLTPMPVLSDFSSFPIISAQSALAIDVASGVTLYEKDPDRRMLPASTTKILTALVAYDYYPLNLNLRVGNFYVEGQKMGLVAGEVISVENLLKGLLISSANDAAEVLASNYPGGRLNFVSVMNEKAKEIGLTNSVFVHPAGLDGNGQYTTAKDLNRAGFYAMQNEFIAGLVGTKEDLVKSADGIVVHELKNINQLVGEVDGVMGVKTGWTENARENLVTYVERGDKKIMISLLGSQDRFGETRELIDWVFSNYNWMDVEVKYY